MATSARRVWNCQGNVPDACLGDSSRCGARGVVRLPPCRCHTSGFLICSGETMRPTGEELRSDCAGGAASEPTARAGVDLWALGGLSLARLVRC